MQKLVDLRKAVNKCNADCPLLDRQSGNFVPFEICGQGNGMPKVVFVGEAPGRQEVETGQPFYENAPAGSILRTTLAELNVNYYGVANIVCCRPVEGNSDRTPTDEERFHCVTHLERFLEMVKPDIVILLGRSAAFSILPESYRKDYSITKLSQLPPYEIEGMLIAANFHPSYIARQGGTSSPNYKTWVDRLNFLLFEQAEAKRDTRIQWKPVHVSKLPEVLEHYSEYEDVGFDYETNRLRTPWDISLRILGFSIAARSKSGRPDITYVYWNEGDILPDEHVAMLKQFLQSRKIWCYNSKFEMSVTWHKFGDLLLLDDSMVLCKIACSPISLKKNARLFLNVPEWEDLVENITDLFDLIQKKAVMIGKKRPEQRQLLLDDHDKFYNEVKEGNIEGSAQEAIVGCIYQLRTYLKPEEITKGLKAPDPWSACPVRYMGEYCSYDAWYTLMLKEKLWPQYGQWYQIYLNQTWLSCVMESYGMCWDDKVASEHDEYYTTEAINCLNTLIPMLDFKKDVLIEEHPDNVGQPKSKQDLSKNTYEEVGCTDETIMDARLIYEDESISDIKKLNKLKSIFNPLSNIDKTRIKFWTNYKSDYTLGCAALKWLDDQIGNVEWMTSEKHNELLNINSVDQTVENCMAFAETLTRKQKGDIYSVLRGIEKIAWDDYFKRFAAEVLEFQYEALSKYGGVVIDDESTWTREFRMLYYLRRYKKVMKSRSTYIWGKIGRQVVALSSVNPKNVAEPPIRKIPREQVVTLPQAQLDKVLSNGHKLILSTSFFENSAETKRWRAGIHTVPWGSELREIYIPRMEDSLMVHWDYSQMEIRTLGAIANEPALKEAFDRGEDIHRFVASKIWRKPQEEVTVSERRFAKTASFSIIYGKSIKNFARDFMNGDFEMAKKFFNDFYDAFPNVRNYIEESHRLIMETGSVPTHYGDPLFIHHAFSDNEKKRKSQNYRIQSSASSLAGNAIWWVYWAIYKLKMQAIPIGFTHDSSDWECHIRHLFQYLSLTDEMAVNKVKRDLNIPVAIDVEIGITMNHMMEIHETGRKSGIITYDFKCNENTCFDIINMMKKYYSVKYEITGEEKEAESLMEMFQPKRAFSKYLGVEQNTIKGNLEINLN